MTTKELFMIPGLDSSKEIQEIRKESMKKYLINLGRIQRARAEGKRVSRVIEVRRSL